MVDIRDVVVPECGPNLLNNLLKEKQTLIGMFKESFDEEIVKCQRHLGFLDVWRFCDHLSN